MALQHIWLLAYTSIYKQVYSILHLKKRIIFKVIYNVYFSKGVHNFGIVVFAVSFF